MAAIAYKNYPFKVTNGYCGSDFLTMNSSATNYLCEPYDTSELTLTGTTKHRLDLKMSPYVHQQSVLSTKDVVDSMVRRYTDEAGLKLSPSRPTAGSLDDCRVVYNNNGWTLEANTYVTGYTTDTITGTLTVDLETVDYYVNGTASDFNDLTFYREGLYETEAFTNTPPKRWRYKSNLLVRRKSRGNVVNTVNDNEKVALQTLREMITEAEYRKYIRYGFVLVPGESGAVYQVFRNRSHTKVWKGGKLIEEVCILINDVKVPPTDSVIAFSTMIRADEEEFKKMGNVYKMAKAA